mgnify:CR=1 FL=1
MADRYSRSNPSESDPYSEEQVQTGEQATAQWRVNMRASLWRPPTDVFETGASIVVRAEIAGMKEEDFLIELHGRGLVIRGARSDVPERKAFHQMEIRFGEFSIELELPAAVDPDRVEALYENGFLKVTLPKAQPHRVPIRRKD